MSRIEKLFALGLGIITVAFAAIAIYVPVAISHFDSEVAGLRASIENATGRFENQISRIDAAFNDIRSIAVNTGEIRVEFGYMKRDIESVQTSVKTIIDDIQRIKIAVKADLGKSVPAPYGGSYPPAPPPRN